MSHPAPPREHVITLRETLYGLVVIALLAWLYLFGIFETVELKMLDLRFQFRRLVQTAREEAPGARDRADFPREKVLIVGLDEKTSGSTNTIMPPRRYHAMLIENMIRLGAKVIAFDVLFNAETSPADDAEFADALARHADRVVLGAQLTEQTVAGVTAKKMLLPHPMLLKPGMLLGLVNQGTDLDGFVRAATLSFKAPEDEDGGGGERRAPSLATATAARHLGREAELSEYFKHLPDDDTYRFRLGSIEIATGRQHNALINFSGPEGTFRSISFIDALSPDLEKEIFPASLDLRGDRIQVDLKRQVPAEVEIREERAGSGSIRGRIANIADFSGEVTVVAVSHVQRMFATAVAGADGRFEIPGLTGGLYRLNAFHEATRDGVTRRISVFAVALRVLDGAPTEGVEVTLPRGNGTVELLAGSADPASAIRRTWRADFDQAKYLAVTGDDGRFSFTGLPSGPATLTASVTDPETWDLVSLRRERVPRMFGAGAGKPYRFHCHVRRSEIFGTISDPAGAPIAGARIVAFQPLPDNSPLLKYDTVFEGVTDERGDFRIGRIVDGGFYGLSVHLPSPGGGFAVHAERAMFHVPGDTVSVDRAKDRTEPENWFEIVEEEETPGDYRGRVVDRAGAPVAGADVALAFMKCRGGASIPGARLETAAGQVARTLEGMIPGEYIAYALEYDPDAERSADGKLKPVRLPAGGRATIEVDLAECRFVRMPARLAGRFIPADGLDAGTVELTLVGDQGVIARAAPRPDGSFLFTGFPSSWVHALAVRRDGGRETGRGAATVGAFDPRGMAVLVGSRNRLQHDFYPTPFDFDPLHTLRSDQSNMYGVEIHANILHTIMNGAGIRRLSYLSNFVIFLAICVSTLLIAQRNSFRGMFLLLTAIVSLLVAGSFYAFVEHRLWINLFMPLLGVLAVYLFAVSYRYQAEQRKKRMIKGIFEKMVPKSVVDQVISDEGAAKVSGKREYLTILFSDIRGFTPMSESMTPEQVVDILNEYMGEMTKIIFRNKGTLDKFIGDAIMVIFGAPVPYEDHPYCAVKTAVEMLQKLHELRRKWGAEGKYQINIGIGINTGDVVVGNMGSDERMNYTVIGDHVNLAARLEANTKGGQILISGETFKYVKDKIIFEKPDPIKVKGKSMLITIYDVKGLKEQEMGRALPVAENAPSLPAAAAAAGRAEAARAEGAAPASGENATPDPAPDAPPPATANGAPEGPKNETPPGGGA